MTSYRWKRRLLVAAIGAFAPLCALHAADQGVQPRVEVLDNGLKILLVERHEQPTVAACLIFDVGSCNDPAGTSGIAHMFEHMMFKGTHVIGVKDYEAEARIIRQQDELREKMNGEMARMRLMKRRGEIDDVLDPAQWTAEYRELKAQYDALLAAERELLIDSELDKLYSENGGAMLNAGTSNDMTIYFVQLPANKLELFFWLESDRFANAVMREFYVERDNVREERRLSTESTPTGKFDEAFEAMFWEAHPYGRPVLGWASEVESITRDDVRNFFKVYYAPNNATLVLVGDFDSDDVMQMARRYLGRIPRGAEGAPAGGDGGAGADCRTAVQRGSGDEPAGPHSLSHGGDGTSGRGGPGRGGRAAVRQERPALQAAGDRRGRGDRAPGRVEPVAQIRGVL